jgi:hypothetical protein
MQRGKACSMLKSTREGCSFVTNKAYQADPDDQQAFRADTEKILKVEDDLYGDISLALDNGASLDEICYRIEIAKIKEGYGRPASQNGYRRPC